MAMPRGFESLMVDGHFVSDRSKVIGLGGDGDLRVYDLGSKQRLFKVKVRMQSSAAYCSQSIFQSYLESYFGICFLV